MLKGALAVARKDLRLVLSGGVGLAQPILLGLILIFVFSLSAEPGQPATPQAAAGIFYLASLFAQVLLFNALYALEEATGARQALLLSPMPPQSVWLGKAVAGFLLLVASQLAFLPAAVVFLGQGQVFGGLEAVVNAVATLLLADWGLAATGSLLGALAQGHSARESLLSIVVFPLLIPLLLAGVETGGVFLGAETFGGEDKAGQWTLIAGAFDLVFTGAALLLFPFVYGGDE